MDYVPNYVVGRGRTFFDKFKKGSNNSEAGELYFGNSPEFTLTTDSETLDHYSSERGMRELDASVLLEMTQGGNFTVDDITADNAALFFLGDKVSVTQTQQTGRKEVIQLIKKGRFFQLGVDDVLPTGIRNINNFTIVVADAGTAVSVGTGDISTIPGTRALPADQYEIDLENGRLYIEPDAADVPGAGLVAAVQYDIAAQARTLVIGRANMIYGALRFISDNPVGANKDYYFPKVSLTPDGDYALKGDDWQVMSFTFRAMKKSSNIERLYIDIRDETVAPAVVEYSITATPSTTTGTVNSAVPVTITVRDESNNVKAGVTVNLTANSGSTVTPSTGTTNSSGQLVVQLNRASAGSGTITATETTSNKVVTSAAVTFS